MTTETGKLLNNENFCGMVENLGDAYEASEECFGMIWWLAGCVAKFEADERGVSDVYRDEVLGVIKRAASNHKEGLKLGDRQRER
jgi:hypothetical protein